MLRLQSRFFSICVYICLCAAILCSSCKQKTPATSKLSNTQKLSDLQLLLESEETTQESRFTIVSQIANDFIAKGQTSELVLFLTEYVEKHPDDQYNAYWLLMVAHMYIEEKAAPIARYYFDRILSDYDDLIVKGTSVHFTALTHLIQLSDDADSRIKFFNEIILRFPDKISLTEMYARLAVEYENIGEWEQMRKCYALFEAQPDATTIQISGIPNAYHRANQMLKLNASAKDWSFESLDALEQAVKNALKTNNFRQLEKYRSRVNFFAMTWRQEETDSNSQANFSMANFMRGKIRFSEKLDETSNTSEAYLRTWGWQQNVSVWYFYFRKINFPLDPDIHGRWEWAGIYYGEKL
ncbi:MAG: tetratricopeptide repeat protein [Spirochaetales bacterium]|nr:tetratricopeptide repeat protein [Spirochaetales bacterium]